MDDKKINKNNNENKNKVRSTVEEKLKSTQSYLKISEIKDDIIILKNGGLRTILRTNAINFHLRSEKEQDSIIFAFQNFLNGLNEFPIQILIRSHKYNLEKYIKNLEALARKQSNRLLKLQTDNYIEFMKYLLNFDIMKKDFFVVVPLDVEEDLKGFGFKSFLKLFNSSDTYDSIENIKRNHRIFTENKSKIIMRTNVIKSGLEQCGLSVHQLNTTELVYIMYESYNPILSYLYDYQNIDMVNLLHKI